MPPAISTPPAIKLAGVAVVLTGACGENFERMPAIGAARAGLTGLPEKD